MYQTYSQRQKYFQGKKELRKLIRKLARYKPKPICCKYCKGTSLAFSKRIHVVNKKKSYHYKAMCKSKKCNKSFFVKRTKHILEKVKSKKWDLMNA